jgi:hypothetical protein
MNVCSGLKNLVSRGSDARRDDIWTPGNGFCDIDVLSKEIFISDSSGKRIATLVGWLEFLSGFDLAANAYNIEITRLV